MRLEPSRSAGVDLARYQGTYAWPDRRIQFTATERGLLITSDDGEFDQGW